MADEPVIIFAGGNPPNQNTSKKSAAKQRPGVALSWQITLTLLVIFILMTAGMAYGLWYAAMGLSQAKVAVIAVALFVSLPVVFFIGHFFGRTEVRGFLSGVDTAVDRIAQAVDLRDGAKLNIHTKVNAPSPQQRPQPSQPNYIHPEIFRPESAYRSASFDHQQQRPLLTYREASDGEILDL